MHKSIKIMWGFVLGILLVGTLTLALSTEIRWSFADYLGLDYKDRVIENNLIESKNDATTITATLHSSSWNGKHTFYFDITNNLPNEANHEIIIRSLQDNDKIIDYEIYYLDYVSYELIEKVIVKDISNKTKNGTKLIDQTNTYYKWDWVNINNFDIPFSKDEIKQYKIILKTDPKSSGKFDILTSDNNILDPTWSYGGVRNQGYYANGTATTDTNIIFNFNVSENSTDDFISNCSLMLKYGDTDVLERNTTIYGAGMVWNTYQQEIDIGAMGCSSAVGTAHDPFDDTIWIVCRLTDQMIHVNLTSGTNIGDGINLTDGSSTTHWGLTFDNNSYLVTASGGDKKLYRYKRDKTFMNSIDHSDSMNNDLSGLTFNGTDYWFCDYNNDIIGSMTQQGVNNTEINITTLPEVTRCEGLDMNGSLIYVADANAEIRAYYLNGSKFLNINQNINPAGMTDISIDGSPAYKNGNVTDLWLVEDTNNILKKFKSEVTEVGNHTIGLTFNSSFMDIYWSVDCWSGNETLNSTSPFWKYTLGTSPTFAPQINNQFPADSSSDYTPYINFTYNVSSLDPDTIDNCTLYLNDVVNTTDLTITETINQTINITLGYGQNLWKINCYDNSSSSANTTEWNYTRNISYPIVLNQFPANSSVINSKYVNFTYNVSAPYGSITSCSLWLNNILNATDTSITQTVNQTFNLTLNNTNYWDWLVECTTDYNIKDNSSLFSFTYNKDPTTPTTIIPNNNTVIISNTNNITCSGSTDPDGGNINYEFWIGNDTSTMSIGQNASITTYNYTFERPDHYYYKCRSNDNVTNSDFTETRRITYAQLYDNCSATNTTSLIALNYSFADENGTRFLNDNITYQATFSFYGNSSIIRQTLTKSLLVYNEIHYCISPKNISIYSDIDIKYSKTGYDERKYTKLNELIDPFQENIILYLIASGTSSTVNIHVSDYDDNKLQDYTIEAWLYDLGTDSYTLVQSELTNFNGVGIFYLDQTEEYLFNVKDTEGVLFYSSGRFKPVDTDYYFRIDISEGIEIDVVTSIRAGITHNLGWDNKSKTASWYVLSSSTLVSRSCLTLKRINLNNDSIISRSCTPITSSVNKTYYYDEENATFLIEGSIVMISNGEEYILERDTVDLTVNRAVDFGLEGVFWGMLITITLFLIGVALRIPEMAIIMLDIGLIFSKATRLLPLKWTNLMGIIVVTIIILVLVRKKEGVFS